MALYDHDVIVIGGGLLGCFAARNLARYDLKIALLEKREDLCLGVSRANTAIVYSGCDTKPGTVKTSMCVKSSQAFEGLCAELGVRYNKCGSIMICFGERGEEALRKKLEQGAQNGVRGIKMLTRAEVLELEPNISENAYAGLYVPDTGTVMPWELCLAAAENAASNGVEIIRGAKVKNISRDSDGYSLKVENASGDALYRARGVVNCAGLNADILLEKVFDPVVRIVPDAGDYYVLDTKVKGFIGHVIFHEPEDKSKGLTLVPTVDGNILAGPTERELEKEEGRGERAGAADTESTASAAARDTEWGGDEPGFETSREGLELLRSLVAEVVPDLPMEHVIRSFGAVRPNPYEVEDGASEHNRGSMKLSNRSVNDFSIIEAADEAFISFVGVKTPGLTCANELGIYAAERLAGNLGAARNKNFDPRRAAQIRIRDMSFEDRESVVRANPDYGRIVCRCKGVTEGEVLDAIRSTPGAVSLDGVKHRAGTGLGRCQGGFCTQHIVEILSRELGGAPEDYLT